MRNRTRILVALTLALAAVPVALLVRTRSSRTAVPARPAPAVVQAPTAAPPGAGAAAPAAPGRSAPPLPPRAAYLNASRTRAIPRPVKPGEPPGGAAPRVTPLPPAPPVSEWAHVEIVNPWGAGSPSPAVTKAIQATLRPRLAECFDRVAEAGWAGLGRSYSALEPAGPPGIGPAILVLEVEEDGAGVTVLDAPVERRGAASDGTLNCAQAVLRGAKLQARGEGKARFRMRYALRRELPR